MHINFWATLTFPGFLVAVSMWLFSDAVQATEILVVASSNDDPYQETKAGFKNFLPQNIKFSELNAADFGSSTWQTATKTKPDLMFALGNEAVNWAAKQTGNIPIVATLVLKETTFKISTNITGVSLNYSLATQFQWLKKFFPQQKSVAVLYNPVENAQTIQATREISQQNGLNFIAIPVESPKELPFALEQLTHNVELLFAIPDETVMSAHTAKEVLLASFRNKVPLIGLSDNWVKSGAFYALSWDYLDIGQQCGGMAKKLLGGIPVKSVTPEHPRKITYTINAKIAEHMNMEIPGDLLKNAKMIYN